MVEVERKVRDRQSRIFQAALAVARLANLTRESYYSTRANLPCRAGASGMCGSHCAPFTGGATVRWRARWAR